MYMLNDIAIFILSCMNNIEPLCQFIGAKNMGLFVVFMHKKCFCLQILQKIIEYKHCTFTLKI